MASGLNANLNKTFKYSVEFNDFAVTQRPHRGTVFDAVRQTLHITVCKKVCGPTRFLVCLAAKYA